MNLSGPKPSETERRYLQLIWRPFQATGRWPVTTELQREVDRSGEKIELWEVASAISPRLAVRAWGSEHEPSARVRGIYETRDDAPELGEFVRLARLCVDRYLGGDTTPKLHRDDLALDDFMAKKAARLLAGEDFLSGWPNEFGPEWESEISTHRSRQFIGFTDLESYLEIEDRLAPRQQARVDAFVGGTGFTEFLAPRSPSADVLRSLLPENVRHELLPKAEAARLRFDQARDDDERRSAVRDLAFVLEAVRDEVSRALPTGKDNAALFEIANKSYIRHSKEDQRADYDPLWLTWVFNLFENSLYTWLGFVIRGKRA